MGVVDRGFAVAALVSRGAVNYFTELFLNITLSLEAVRGVNLSQHVEFELTVGAGNPIEAIPLGTTFHDMSASRIPLRRS